MILGKSRYGGKSFYRNITVDSTEDCWETCINSPFCAAVSFTGQQFGGNRCFLYKKGEFEFVYESRSEMRVKHCPKGKS